MGNIRQTKCSGNSFWSNRLYHHEEGISGAIELSFHGLDYDSPPDGPYSLTEGIPAWFKFTTDGMDDLYGFITFLGEGFGMIPGVDSSNILFYETNGVTALPVDEAGFFQNHGSPFLGYIGYFGYEPNVILDPNTTYYVKLIPPITAEYHVVVLWD